jgi:hypothetical protein
MVKVRMVEWTLRIGLHEKDEKIWSENLKGRGLLEAKTCIDGRDNIKEV